MGFFNKLPKNELDQVWKDIERNGKELNEAGRNFAKTKKCLDELVILRRKLEGHIIAVAKENYEVKTGA